MASANEPFDLENVESLKCMVIGTYVQLHSILEFMSLLQTLAVEQFD